MKSRIVIGILIVLVVFGALAGVKTLQIKRLMDSGKAYVQAPESVSSAVVHEEKGRSRSQPSGRSPPCRA